MFGVQELFNDWMLCKSADLVHAVAKLQNYLGRRLQNPNVSLSLTVRGEGQTDAERSSPHWAQWENRSHSSFIILFFVVFFFDHM